MCYWVQYNLALMWIRCPRVGEISTTQHKHRMGGREGEACCWFHFFISTDYQTTTCDLHFYRPWYDTTVSSQMKDVVILVQTSTTMSDRFGTTGQSLLQAAIKYSYTIIDSLNSNDRVSVIIISCFRRFYLFWLICNRPPIFITKKFFL